jgi:cytochrome c5
MSEPHHDPISDNIETHPVKLAAGVAVGAIALVVAIVLLAQFAVGAYGSRSIKDDASMKPEAVARRVAPVATLALDPSAPAPAAAAAAPVAVAVAAPAAKGGSAADAGKKTYDSACTACHASGVAGAPKLGDKAGWAVRVKTGKDALYASALKGKGAMPPKGGNTALADADVKAAVDYLLASVK